MTTVYINGKETPKEELKNIEITNEGVKRILVEALYKRGNIKAETPSNDDPPQE